MAAGRNVFDPHYWRERIKGAPPDRLHLSVCRCSLEAFQAAEKEHEQVLANLIKPQDYILDAGCAWGRLLDLLPESWDGDYTGVDLSSDFIDLARFKYPGRNFIVDDLRSLPKDWTNKFDCAVLVSVRQMILGDGWREEWDKIEREMKRVARRVLCLEYDGSGCCF